MNAKWLLFSPDEIAADLYSPIEEVRVDGAQCGFSKRSIERLQG